MRHALGAQTRLSGVGEWRHVRINPYVNAAPSVSCAETKEVEGANVDMDANVASLEFDDICRQHHSPQTVGCDRI